MASVTASASNFLLYRKNLDKWLKDKKQVKSFDSKDVDNLRFLRRFPNQEAYKSYLSSRDVSGQQCMFGDEFGAIYYTVSGNNNLFEFHRHDKRKSDMYKFDWKRSNKKALLPFPYSDKEDSAPLEEDLPQGAVGQTQTDKPEVPRVSVVVQSSLKDLKYLGITEDGHIILIDCRKKTAIAIARWGAKKYEFQGCFGGADYSDVAGAISDDLSTAVFTAKPSVDETPCKLTIKVIQLDSFDTEDIAISFEPELISPSAMCIAFRAFSNREIVLNFYSCTLNDAHDYNGRLITVDVKTGTVLAKFGSIEHRDVCFPQKVIYGSYSSVEFFHSGDCFPVLWSPGEYEDLRGILILDTSTLNILMDIDLSSGASFDDGSIEYSMIYGRSKSELAVVKKNEEVLEIEVYSIPDVEISLKRLCYKVIRVSIADKNVKKLPLPKNLIKYL